ncbi:hypothetical protein L6452_14376 [Arctium lappa]|uniref:Uncharacterized protein n=1 Tax=Arctium lappa TaxID=4217 RepID=A0ACB9CKW0_ARCLA|nr:hypothetical protein L6452_14376 [Arctium lappa]
MNPFDESWEEEAFAEDGRGPLGGFVWPPTSYSCSFCKREFRSAQALGGHMNIHRRERARLKQSLTDTTTPPQNPYNLHQNLSNPSFSSSPSSRVSLRTLCSNSDTKSTSCVCDHDQVQMLLPSSDHGVVETNFSVGCHLNSPSGNGSSTDDHRGFDDEEVMNCKRQKTIVMPLIMGSIEEVDLELRLAT